MSEALNQSVKLSADLALRNAELRKENKKLRESIKKALHDMTWYHHEGHPLSELKNCLDELEADND